MQSLSQFASDRATRSRTPAGSAGLRPAAGVLAWLLSLPACGADLLDGFDAQPLAVETADGKRHELLVYVARTDEQKRTGLMFVEALPPGRGMLFTYDPPRIVSMWMKNTLISLDMLFVRSDGIVERIAARTEPLSERRHVSGGEVGAVLELNGGTAETLGIRAGARLLHPWFVQRDH